MTVSGGKPVGLGPYQCENFSGYGAVEPVTGESFFLELPQLNTVNFQILLNEFTQHYQATLNIVLMDNGSCHTAKSLVIAENLGCLFLPPYSPELNPIERLWHDVKQQLASVLVSAIDELEHHVERILNHYSKAAIRSLTSYPYVVQAVHALCS
jgi:transposase